ncbi:MAG: cupin domain-containing protein [Candidatus Aminicenantes bacterium]|nr:cupin domain-containing protein [Candidatus Aminicenantes bacterium]
MIIKLDSDVKENVLKDEGVKNVRKKVLIGTADGSENIIMRRFLIFPGGNTPYHEHPHEHVIRVEKGRGMVVDGEGKEKLIREGSSLFISGGEKHQFRNPFSEPFGFLCIILNQDENTR